MTASIPSTPTRFVGFDSGGEVFLSQGRVLRGIYPGEGVLYRKVLRICETHDLFQLGIVKTRELQANPHPSLPYDIVLEHEKIPFITYPHEWPASMLKVAALFHIDLYARLGPYGLTVKDWHPYNILFKGTEPVFVDFTSIIPVYDLRNEEYLTPPCIPRLFRNVWDTTSAYFYEMYRRMFVPYFLFPLYMINNGNHSRARRRMLETAMNTADSVIRQDEVFNAGSRGWKHYKAKDLLKKLALSQRSITKRWFLRLLRAEVKRLSVFRQSSNYSDYYSAKNEGFGFEPSSEWTEKQHTTYQAIKRLGPRTLLDMGSNTGWFSIMAARLGCQVVAFDIDEACADILYQRARQYDLDILPLVMDMTKLTRDIPPLDFENEPSRSLIGGQAPLLLSAEKRLKCDMVLALAIVHHLALGHGIGFDEIVNKLGAFVTKYLLIEFVAKEDKLIEADPDFFPAYNADPRGFGWYTLDRFTRELRRRFRDVDIRKSHPESRVILICTR
ncbi:MAG: class I SAM-dependent methyltransferase [Planctomycetota bacterium]|nr:MAG: class I SAM-dependent methyltransferase [Planctomycetota bacterium]